MSLNVLQYAVNMVLVVAVNFKGQTAIKLRWWGINLTQLFHLYFISYGEFIKQINISIQPFI